MTTQKRPHLYDGEEFEHNGMRFVVSFENDNDTGAPWKNSDGHGPVSEDTRRDKKPGEWVLSSDRYSKRYYDAAEATCIAKRDGWGISDEKRYALTLKLGRAPTKAEVTAEAVRSDFEYLRGWVNDEWHYVGVCVRHVSQSEDDRYSFALWGIESESDAYITETAHELSSECAGALLKEVAEERAALKTNRKTFSELALDLRNSAALRPAICAAVRQQLAMLMAKRRESMARIVELTA